MILPISIVYFSNKSENTKRLVEKITDTAHRIPVKWENDNPFYFIRDYVLFVPTYGSGNDGHSIPAAVKKFLNIPENRQGLRGVIGTGNTNFGSSYCKAAHMISAKANVPLIAQVELLGTDEDVETIKERLWLLYGK